MQYGDFKWKISYDNRGEMFKFSNIIKTIVTQNEWLLYLLL